ncbi:D-2-hydroxyacid dehydrogenase family protein [Streptomyces bathyalis]|uniref:D-2-hydroxyacid dehydrogenase family protein n=1 Tax=Streptomyces bathyalis TaxID=2710756 RepID=A0A7T1T7G6_9ACTN|nr:D-2-hydroxyacid dehydrogenase family protein [Streptomyces bathyalis]QPP07786.1 D-2-hydroxyacid dehydrogenase family protein [Streptomyces bathyalis]
MRVAVLDDYQQAAHHFADWQSLDAEVTFLHEHITDDDALAEALRGYDVVVAMRERTPFTAERFERLPDLRLLVTTGMANASIDVAAAERHGVTVCGTQSPATATPELTWGLILSLLRHIPAESTGVREGQWQHSIGGDLYGRTLGIVGLGRLGSRVAAVGRAFGMRVLAWSSNLEPATARERGAEPVSKQTLFSEADIVTVHYKLSERSMGLIGTEELSWMKSTAYLVNTSRGPLIDTEALVDALIEGRIAGAGLDVYEVEPLPADAALRTAPRTVLTPHIGYVTEGTYRVFYGEAVEDIAAWAAGEPVRRLTP